MTSIHTLDPCPACNGSGSKPEDATSELAPLPIGALALGVYNLLQAAADLPAPCAVFIYRAQCISVQFDGAHPSSIRAITRWSVRFGSVLTCEPNQGEDGTETWYTTGFDFNGVAVTAYAHIKAATAAT